MEDQIELSTPLPPTYSIDELIQIIAKMKSDLKSTLSCLPKNLLSDINAVIDAHDEFIMKHCRHSFVYDMIDITPDHSKTICYCSKCELSK